jgi:hypothetical protein
VEQTSDHGEHVRVDLSEDSRYGEGVGDVRLSGEPRLVSVHLGRELVSAPDEGFVHIGVVPANLLD